MPGERGTSNGNSRGNARDRANRRAWLLKTYEADVPGFCRCYRCGMLLCAPERAPHPINALTVDRIVPGAKGGRYVRTNIRPACLACNSETGGSVRR